MGCQSWIPGVPLKNTSKSFSIGGAKTKRFIRLLAGFAEWKLSHKYLRAKDRSHHVKQGGGDMESVKIEDKLQLAKQLKLERQVSIIQYEKGMFDLKFKPINLQQIKNRLKIGLKRRLEVCWVNDFSYPIPYGAMLAQKEAGDAGILRHQVWYPVKTNPFTEMFRTKIVGGGIPAVSDDPIITGFNRSGKMMEIFAWNEDDVYES